MAKGFNHISEVPQDDRYPFPLFEVGDGCSYHMYSDSHAYRVIKVSKSGMKVTVQRDDVKLLNADDLKFHPGGFAAHCSNQRVQKYEYTPNPDGGIMEFSLRKWRGRYVWTPIRCTPNGHMQLTKGSYEFYDYNF